jgi:hypothetical protein
MNTTEPAVEEGQRGFDQMARMGRCFLDNHAAGEAGNEAAEQAEVDRVAREVASLSVAESAHKVGGWALVVVGMVFCV